MTSREPAAGTSRRNLIAPDAEPVVSVTEADGGRAARPRYSDTSPPSNVVAPNPSIFASGMTNFSPLAITTLFSVRSDLISDTPPLVARNCHGGFTWNGRTARNSVTACFDRARFSTRYLTKRVLAPFSSQSANAVTSRPRSSASQFTTGIGRSPSRSFWLRFASAHVTRRFAEWRNGSIEKPRWSPSTAHSSLVSASLSLRGAPTTVQYD